jgi:hypothetical protein
MSQVNLDKNNAYFLNFGSTGGWLQAAETEEICNDMDKFS